MKVNCFRHIKNIRLEMEINKTDQICTHKSKRQRQNDPFTPDNSALTSGRYSVKSTK